MSTKKSQSDSKTQNHCNKPNWQDELLRLILKPKNNALFAETIDFLEQVICILPNTSYGSFVNLITLLIEMLRTVKKTIIRIATCRRS